MDGSDVGGVIQGERKERPLGRLREIVLCQVFKNILRSSDERLFALILDKHLLTNGNVYNLLDLNTNY